MRLFHYYGTKHAIAGRYPAPAGDRIVEPFAGAAAYSCRHHDRDVVLVEKNPRVAALLRYLATADPKRIAALPIPEPGQRFDELGLPIEERDPIARWCNVGQMGAKPGAWWVRMLREGRLERCGWLWSPLTRARLAEFVPLIRHWAIVEGDAMEDSPAGEATWFVDPPYQVAGAKYPNGSRDINYPALAEWCRSLRGRVIVCEQAGARWLPFERLADVQRMPNAGRGRSTECVYVRDVEVAVGGAS